MDKERNRQTFVARNPDLIRREELAQAAKWWAINATAMPPADPWKSHMALLPIVSLLAQNARELEQWLIAADSSVNGGLRQSIYADARLELLSESPPWLGKTFATVQDGPEFRAIRRGELGRLLEEIRVDSAIQIEQGKVV
jgi:hypothetical protein